MVIFFYRIDEFKQLESKVDKITTFINEILQDTTLLLISNISFIFIIWSRIKTELMPLNIRFDKFKPLDITWSRGEIESILNLQLNFFSSGKISINDIIKDDNEYNIIIDVSNNSPRDLFRLLSCIYDEQFNDNLKSNFFESKNILIGIDKFIKNYNFYSLYPAKKGTREDIYNVINEILSLSLNEFTVTDIMRVRKIAQQTAISHLKTMKNYNLIQDITDTRNYKVVDPKILYLIKNNCNSDTTAPKLSNNSGKLKIIVTYKLKSI